MGNGKQRECVYFDTNILSHLAKNQSLWGRLIDHLLTHNLWLAVGSQLSELADADRLHDQLARLMISAPSVIIKGPDEVLDEEIAAHPGRRTDGLDTFVLNSLVIEPDGIEQIKAQLSASRLKQVRADQRTVAAGLAHRHLQLRPNFPPSGSRGKYERQQAAQFAWCKVVDELAGRKNSFLKQFEADLSNFNDETFRSIRLRALVVFYRYYLGARVPGRVSDLGDLAFLYALPYCREVVIERDMAETLRQVAKHDCILDGVGVHDIVFLREVCGERAG